MAKLPRFALLVLLKYGSSGEPGRRSRAWRVQTLAELGKVRNVSVMNDATSPTGDEPGETIRRELERVDEALLAAMTERLRLSDQLAGVDSPRSGPPIRPSREVALLRRLAAAAPGDREVVADLWRVLLAASSRRQRALDIVVGASRGDAMRLYDVARRHFGARARIKDVGEPQIALQKAVDNPDSVIAITSWPAAPGVGAWWPALTEQRYRSLSIIAALPVTGAAADTPEAAVFAAAAPEAAGGDISLLLAFDPHHRVQRALAEAGLVGKEVARAEPRVLVRVEGFVTPDDPRAAALARTGLDAVRLLGAYALI